MKLLKFKSEKLVFGIDVNPKILLSERINRPKEKKFKSPQNAKIIFLHQCQIPQGVI